MIDQAIYGDTYIEIQDTDPKGDSRKQRISLLDNWQIVYQETTDAFGRTYWEAKSGDVSSFTRRFYNYIVNGGKIAKR